MFISIYRRKTLWTKSVELQQQPHTHTRHKNMFQSCEITCLSSSVDVITFRISSPILFSSINILQYASHALISPLSRKWNSKRSNSDGIIASATAISSFGTMEFRAWLLMPWSEQKPSAFITDLSPQSQAPPACDKNILKSWVEWSPFLKQFRHMDMHGEIAHVRHRYATTCGIQTSPHFKWLSYCRTVFVCAERNRRNNRRKRVNYSHNTLSLHIWLWRKRNGRKLSEQNTNRRDQLV